jgi:beta-aspartyl-dipeptidase (metallo-type)
MILIKQAGVHAPAHLGTADVLVSEGHILSIAEAIEPPQIPGVAIETIDAHGMMLVPGLVDSLVHVTGGGGEGGFGGRTSPLAAEQALAAGVTTVIGCLGTDAITRSHADLVATARALEARGLSCFCLTGSYALPAGTLTGSIESDLVLIPEIIGLGEVALADHRGAQPTWQELARATADCRRGAMLAGKRGTVLLHLGDGRQPLKLLREVLEHSELPRNQFLPTHCNRGPDAFEDALNFGLEGGNLDFTTSTTAPLLEAGEVPAARALALALDKGVDARRLSLSSDAQASLPAFGDEQELSHTQVASIGSLWASVREAVVTFGVPLEAALAAVTGNPARMFGLADRGRIEAGLRADLLLLDPETFNPTVVISDGRVRWRCSA